jgi:DNA-nicking Smr family endonuclease
MTDDWTQFKKLIARDKTVEKCKKVKSLLGENHKPHRKIIATTDTIKPIEPLIRDIFIDDRRSVERVTLKKLGRGSHKIDIAVDLHGYTISDSYNIFYETFLTAINSGYKLLLVITGKGDMGGKSIRSSLLKWVNIPEISSYIIYMSHADKNHGGSGAFYIVLRKKK